MTENYNLAVFSVNDGCSFDTWTFALVKELCSKFKSMFIIVVSLIHRDKNQGLTTRK